MFDGSGRLPILDGRETVGVHSDAGCGDGETEKGDGRLVEDAFFEFGEEVVIAEALQDFGDNVIHSGLVGGVDEDVVKVTDNVFTQHVPENGIHHMMKGGMGNWTGPISDAV